MRISPLTYANQSYFNNNVNFGAKTYTSKPDTTSPVLDKILDSGFKMQSKVNLVAPDGRPFEGYGFIKDGGKYWGITTLITDDKFYEVGSLSTGSIENGKVWLSGKNLTTQNSPMPADFMTPLFVDSARTPNDGYYKRVMIEACDTLIDYIKTHDTGIHELKGNARSQRTWDLSKRYGFESKHADYNPNAYMNEVSYKI